MNLNHLLDIAVGLVVAWVASLEVRARISDGKLAKYQQKERDDEITERIELKSDAAVDADLAKRLPRS